MIRNTLILMTLSLCYCACDNDLTIAGQQSETLEMSSEEDSIEHFHRLLNAVDEFQDVRQLVGECERRFESVIQQLDFGAYFINEYVETKIGVQMHLKYLVQDSTVLYALVASIDTTYRSQLPDLVIHQNEEALQQYATQHQGFYGKDYRAEQLIHELFTAAVSIRIACGNGSVAYGDTERQLFKAVRDRKLSYISDMLRSVAPERQALGVIAVQKLTEGGYEASESIIKIKDHILERNSLVSACVSCIYGGTYTLQDYLSRYPWELIPNIDLD